MNTVILALHQSEYLRICNAARWHPMTANSPNVAYVTDSDYVQRLMGVRDGLCLITEGALRHGIDPAVVGMLMGKGFVVMCMYEPIQPSDLELTVKERRINIKSLVQE